MMKIRSIIDTGTSMKYVVGCAVSLLLVIAQPYLTEAQQVVPDLTVVSVSGPTSANTESSLTATAVVKNIGTGTSNRGSFTAIYLSTDNAITTSDTRIGTCYAGLLAAGATHTCTITYAVPWNNPTGTYSIGAIADYDGREIDETDETNNTLAGNQITLTRTTFPDLVVTSVSGPTSANTESSLTATAVVKNIGTGTSNRGSFTAIYLSTDNAITTSDTRIGTCYAGLLAAGATHTCTITYAVPWNNPTGTYSIGAIADYDGREIDETDETNNALVGNQIYIGTDTTPPSGSISINNGGVATNNTTATLNLSATDTQSSVSQMQFSNDNTTWSVAEPYVTSKSWTLTAGDGTKTVYVKFKDTAGNWSIAYSNAIVLDTMAPVTTAAPASGTYNIAQSVTLVSSETGTIYYTTNGEAPTIAAMIYTGPLSLAANATTVLKFFAQDMAGNSETVKTQTYTIDTIAPVVAISSPVSGNTNTNRPLLSYTASEDTAVVKLDNAVIAKTSGDLLDLVSEGTHTVRVESTDAAGNTGFAEAAFTVANEDTTPPTTAISTNPSSPDGANDWFKTIPTITLTSDASGTTFYQWGLYGFLRQAQEWTSGGAHLNIRGDDTGAWYTLPFSFTFYGISYSRVFLSSNGLLSFDSENADYYDEAGLSSRLAIAPLWDDLMTNTRSADDIYVFRPDADSIGFRWQAVTYRDEKDINFEVILYRDGRIRFNYGTQNGGLYGTIGISKGDGINYTIAYDGDISSTNNVDSVVFSLNGWTVYTGQFAALSGKNTLYYYSKDNSENVEATNNHLFKVDAAMPIVSITAPLAGFTNNTMPLLSFTLNKVTSTYTVMVDGVIVDKFSGDTLDPLSEGPHTIRVDVTDYAGNTAFAETTFTVVSFAPTINIASPAAGATNNSEPLLSYTVNYGTVTVKVDGVAVNKASGENLEILAEGPHTVRVESMDAGGNNTFAEVNFIVDITPPLASGISSFIKISIGEIHSTAITSDGNMWQWGSEIYGRSIVTWPTAIGTAHAWTTVSSGLYTNLALKTDGSLWAWGDNSYGQFGDGSLDNKITPVRIGTDTDWKTIVTSGIHSVALKNDGTLWTWGINQYGQLGDGSTDDKYTPVRIGTDTNWSAISAGPYHTVALKTNGTLWAWGDNWYGQLGDGTRMDQHVPIRIGSDANWTAISASDVNTVALKADGTLWAWGVKGCAQLGDGTIVIQPAPIWVGYDTNWVAISSAVADTIALKSDGTLWAWGCSGWSNVLGDGSTDPKYISTPVRIGNDTNWSSIAAGGYHTMALKSDGTLWSWGWNFYGQLGDGTTQAWAIPHFIFSTDNAIVINNGAALTNSVSAVLTLNAWDVMSGVAFMQFSNDGTTWSAPEPYATTANWMLGSENGVKTVSVMFQDAAGNWSAPFSSTIILDTVAPVVTITSPIAGVTDTHKPLLTYAADDGIVVVKVDSIIVNKVSGNALDPLANGDHTVRVEATDPAGNMGAAEVAFTVASFAPTVVMTSPSSLTTNNRTPLLSYTVSDGTVIVKVDGVVVNKVSGNTLTSLADGSHTVRVEATNASNYTDFAEVTFTVDATPPSVSISSPIAGMTNDDTPVLIYSVSDGAVTVKVDGYTVSKVSGNTFDTLVNGSHTVRVEARDAANNTGYAEVTFTVNTAATGNDDTNIYCKGTATYLVGYSNFTSGIPVPGSNNAVWIASPGNYSTINNTKVIIKGAMDTTIPVSAVSVLVTNSTGSASYLAQVNGKYFAAQVPITTGDNTITVTATDYLNVQHQASVIVSGTGQTANVTLTASPNVGIPMLKQSGQTLLDVALMTSASLTTTVANYAWDFSGTGFSDLTCYSHSNVNVSYEHVGLYLTTVTVADTAGHTFKDTAIVNVLDRNEQDNFFKQIWNGMKNALAAGDTATALNFIMPTSRQKYSEAFTTLQADIAQIAADMQDIEIVYAGETVAKSRIRKDQIIDGQMETITYYIYFGNRNGVWQIEQF